MQSTIRFRQENQLTLVDPVKEQRKSSIASVSSVKDE